MFTSHKFCLCIVSSKGKKSLTDFKKLYFDGQNSYVACILLGYPKTGRMHQIRVHLQYLGFPIIGDCVYGHKTAFGPSRGKGGIILETNQILLSLVGNSSDILMDSEFMDNLKTEKYLINYPPEYINYLQEDCEECVHPNIVYFPKNEMCLHSYNYKFDEFEFTTSLPSWFPADKNITINHILQK
ncbi:hypothetical protein HZS_1868 [Henneguya salminicola]|nr:hypothetical protein HZS_1868 [Henneguya salminicola]